MSLCGLDYKDTIVMPMNLSYVEQAAPFTTLSDDNILQIEPSDYQDQIMILNETVGKLTVLLCFYSSNANSVAKAIPILNQVIRLMIKYSYIKDDILNSITNEEIAQILSSQITDIQHSPNCLSQFAFSNILAYAINLKTNDDVEIVHVLHLCQRHNKQTIQALFEEQGQMISLYLFNIIQNAEHYSFHVIIIKSLEILISNSNQVYLDNFDILQFDIFIHSYFVNAISSIDDNNSIQIQLLLYLFSGFNIKMYFQNQIGTQQQVQFNIITFFLNLAIDLNYIQFKSSCIRSLTVMIENFDLILNENDPILKAFCALFQQVNEIELHDQLACIIHLDQIELLIALTNTVDDIPNELSQFLLQFLLIEFVLSTQADNSRMIEKILQVIGNMTSSPGFLMDSIVAIPGFLENVFNLIDDSSFSMKFHICTIMANLLFEASQYFEEIMSRLDIVGKIKHLLWSSNTELYKVVSILLMNIINNVVSEQKELIASELLDEGILESFEMILQEADHNESANLHYIYEFDEMIKNYYHREI